MILAKVDFPRSTFAIISMLTIASTAVHVGCKRSETSTEQKVQASASTGADPSHPPDRMAPDELFEGPEKALGITLPRGTKVEHAFSTTVFAANRAKLEPLVSYFRTRVRGGTLTKGRSSATFEHVQVPANPGREIRIKLNEIVGLETRIEIFDSTAPPVPNLPTEEERMRAGGLTKDGKLLDPKHLE